MSRELLEIRLWGMLLLSIALTVGGLSARMSRPLFDASELSFAFGIVSIFSIGIFVLALALIQFVLAIAVRGMEYAGSEFTDRRGATHGSRPT